MILSRDCYKTRCSSLLFDTFIHSIFQLQIWIHFLFSFHRKITFQLMSNKWRPLADFILKPYSNPLTCVAMGKTDCGAALNVVEVEKRFRFDAGTEDKLIAAGAIWTFIKTRISIFWQISSGNIAQNSTCYNFPTVCPVRLLLLNPLLRSII